MYTEASEPLYTKPVQRIPHQAQARSAKSQYLSKLADMKARRCPTTSSSPYSRFNNNPLTSTSNHHPSSSTPSSFSSASLPFLAESPFLKMSRGDQPHIEAESYEYNSDHEESPSDPLNPSAQSTSSGGSNGYDGQSRLGGQNGQNGQRAFVSRSHYHLPPGERLRGVANRIIFSRYYILFYFVMMCLSLGTVVISLVATRKYTNLPLSRLESVEEGSTGERERVHDGTGRVVIRQRNRTAGWLFVHSPVL